MKTLLLLRNALSENTPGSDDFYRVLGVQGIQSGDKLPGAIKDALQGVEVIICSSAPRALETKKMIDQYLNAPIVHLYKELYDERSDYSILIWKLLSTIPDSKEKVLIIGHNPGFTRFYNDAHGHYEKIHFPTMGLAILKLYGDSWQNLSPFSVYSKVLID